MATAIPTNVAPFSIHELLVITGGRLLTGGAGGVVGVSTDTRTVARGNLFVALVGGRHDGHAHAAAAAEKGAAVLLVSRPVEAPAGVAVVQVPDTLLALGALGRAHRRRWAASTPATRTVVGITGSAGKTTTRVAVSAALRAFGWGVHASHGNLNNAVGVPVVLLGLTDEHEQAVVEIGTSSQGEIAYGCSLAEPDTGVVTLVAAAHTESIGTVDDVAHEKGAMFAALPRDGSAIANADDPRVRAQLFRSLARPWYTYGESADADVRIVERQAQGLTLSRLKLGFSEKLRGFPFEEAEVEFTTPLLGVAGAYACAAALAVVGSMQVDDPSTGLRQVTQALGSIEGEGGRLRALHRSDGTVVIDDSYNANRASVVASLRTAAELARGEGRRLVAVLGEMRELGALSAEEHRIVGREAAAQGAAVVVAVTGDAAEIARAASSCTPGPEVVYVPDAERALDAVAARLRPGDLVLVKGSRGVGLDRVVSALVPPPEPPR